MTIEEYIETLEEPRRSDIRAIHDWVVQTVPHLARDLVPPMIGYGPYRYKYASGREGDWFKYGVSNRKSGISIHVMAGDANGYLPEQYRDRLKPAKVGKSCIVVKRARDLNFEVLAEVFKRAEELGNPFSA